MKVNNNSFTKPRLLFIVLALLSFTLNACNSNQENEVIDFANNKIIAHRGAWKSNNLPQNSIASLRQAINLKCAGSEFDVRMTSDEILVVAHDSEYHGLKIETSTYKELSKFKLSNGENLPRLDDYLEKGMINNSSTALILEIKPTYAVERNSVIAKKTIDLVKELNAEKYISYYISFSYDILKTIKQIDSNLKVQYLDGKKPPLELQKDNIDGMDYHLSEYKNHPEWISEARENNVILNAWTVNKSEDINWLITEDFDFITTDQPELALQLSEESVTNREWQLEWSDEFNYSGRIDSTKWAYEFGLKRNQEKQYYTDKLKNVRVEKGVLIIEAHKETIPNDAFISKSSNSWKTNWENADYTSGSITTKGLAEWTYGRIDIRAKLPKGVGLWPAFWMIGANYSEVGWPECGEIDIMEHVGFDPDSIFGTIHTKAYNHMKGTQKGKSIFINDPYNTFHVFTLEWTPDSMSFILDGKTYNHIENENKTTDEWPFDQDFHLKINLAVGGMLGGRKGIDDKGLPSSMEIDYVRVFKKTDETK